MINYNNRSVTFLDDLVTVGLQIKGQPDGTLLRLSSPISIAPRSVLLAPVRIPVWFHGTTSIIQPLQVAPNQTCLV